MDLKTILLERVKLECQARDAQKMVDEANDRINDFDIEHFGVTDGKILTTENLVNLVIKVVESIQRSPHE